ncbi:MAG: substrate-binding domain-containing protein [Acidimicrobiales bacterium]
MTALCRALTTRFAAPGPRRRFHPVFACSTVGGLFAVRQQRRRIANDRSLRVAASPRKGHPIHENTDPARLAERSRPRHGGRPDGHGRAQRTGCAAAAGQDGRHRGRWLRHDGAGDERHLRGRCRPPGGSPIALYNIPSFPGSSLFNVPADANCQEVNWTATPAGGANPIQKTAPAGSGSGRNELNAEAGLASGQPDRGCLDIARSSSFGQNSPTNSFQLYAFALDAVGWASPSLNAPGAMKKSDLIKIYNCTYTDWSQLPGGGTGQIQRYLPQSGSGTYQFFLSDVLDGFNPATVSSGSCPAVKNVDKNNNPMEENQADLIPDADWQTAILRTRAASGPTRPTTPRTRRSIAARAPTAATRPSSVGSSTTPSVVRCGPAPGPTPASTPAPPPTTTSTSGGS